VIAVYQERRFGLRLGLALALVGCSYDVTLGRNSVGLGDKANLDAPVTPGDPGTVDVTVDVRSDTGRHAISPLIYGIRYNTDFAANSQTLYSVSEVRWSTYNWEINASNSAYQTNQNDDYLSNSDEPGQAVKSRLEDPVARGVAVLLVLPIGGRVSADKFANGDVRDSGSDYLATRFNQNAPQKTGPLSVNPDLGDALVYQDEFVSWVRSQFPSAQVLFAMDQEPDLWTTTMPAARPEALNYAELVQRNVDSAAAVKRVWPAAEVLGLTSYGWSGWEFLIDPVTEQPPPDAQGEFIDYYLAQLRGAEQSQGKRLIDYLDLHWDSEARGDSQRVTRVEDATARLARIQAPRSLWDPSYTEDSWITQTAFPTSSDPPLGPIALIPRIRERIAQSYPGTKLALGSWLFGGSNDISGAIAVADTLGILGREDVGAAALARAPGPFSLGGFHAFTNYDGQGSRFGDTSISAQVAEADAAAVSAYASVDEKSPSRVVLVLINKREVPTVVGLRLAHPTVFAAADVWQLGPASASIGYQGVLHATANNAFSYPMPPLTVAVVVPKP
jgi:hypothetical protein